MSDSLICRLLAKAVAMDRSGSPGHPSDGKRNRSGHLESIRSRLAKGTLRFLISLTVDPQDDQNDDQARSTPQPPCHPLVREVRVYRFEMRLACSRTLLTE